MDLLEKVTRLVGDEHYQDLKRLFDECSERSMLQPGVIICSLLSNRDIMDLGYRKPTEEELRKIARALAMKEYEIWIETVRKAVLELEDLKSSYAMIYDENYINQLNMDQY